MIHIPTGSVSPKLPRGILFVTGIAALAASFIPALAGFSALLRDYGLGATGLGATVGK